MSVSSSSLLLSDVDASSSFLAIKRHDVGRAEGLLRFPLLPPSFSSNYIHLSTTTIPPFTPTRILFAFTNKMTSQLEAHAECSSLDLAPSRSRSGSLSSSSLPSFPFLCFFSWAFSDVKAATVAAVGSVTGSEEWVKSGEEQKEEAISVRSYLHLARARRSLASRD